MSEDLLVPGKKVVKLMLVEVNDGELNGRQAKQSNKYYNMYEQGDGTFIASYGRVDSTEQRKTYPMDKWDKTYKSKTTRKKSPYKDVTHLFQEVDQTSCSSSPVVQIKDTAVRTVMDTLQSYASKSIQQNYTVSAKSVTQAQVNEAQDIVDQLISDINAASSVKQINKKMLDLYHVIPRKMGNVKNHILDDNTDVVASKRDILKQLEDEQQTLDVMAGQVDLNSKEDQADTSKTQQDVLSILGLEMKKASASEIETIKKLMGPNAHQFKSAYAVKHIATQKKFDHQLDNCTNKDVELFWHGSRNQNWLNILSTGLMIRPAGAIHTGSMFGDGIYFADKAQKSIGYTSLRGSYWASGYDNTAYIALFSVHVGNQKHIHRHDRSCYSLNRSRLQREGFDSVFAHGGADLRNNEYVIYDGAQCTVSFLIEIGG